MSQEVAIKKSIVLEDESEGLFRKMYNINPLTNHHLNVRRVESNVNNADHDLFQRVRVFSFQYFKVLSVLLALCSLPFCVYLLVQH